MAGRLRRPVTVTTVVLSDLIELGSAAGYGLPRFGCGAP